jgi:hypothetical protein
LAVVEGIYPSLLRALGECMLISVFKTKKRMIGVNFKKNVGKYLPTFLIRKG